MNISNLSNPIHQYGELDYNIEYDPNIDCSVKYDPDMYFVQPKFEKYSNNPYRDVQYDCEDWSDAHAQKYDPALLHAILVLSHAIKDANQDVVNQNVAMFGQFLDGYRKDTVRYLDTNINTNDIDIDIGIDKNICIDTNINENISHPFFSKLEQYILNKLEYIPELDQRGNHLASESIERHKIAVEVFRVFPNSTMEEFCEALKARDPKLFTNYRIQKIRNSDS